MELWEVPRVPVTVENLTDGTPSKFCKGASEENMTRIFHVATKGAVTRIFHFAREAYMCGF
jgi:hypothetical protein